MNNIFQPRKSKTAQTRRNLAAALLAACLLTTAGCLKSELRLILKDNGSGSLDVNYSVSDTATSQFRTMTKWKDQMNSLMGETNAAQDSVFMNLFLDPDETRIRNHLARYEKNGIMVENLKVRSRNAWRLVELQLAFKNLADAAKADFFKDSGFSLYKQKDGNYRLHRDRESSNSSAADIFSDPDNVKVITPFLEGFKFVVRTDVPGKIIETNAGSKGPRTATWIFDYNRDPASFAALQTQDFDVVFEGKDLNLPTVKIVKKKADASE